MIYTGCVESRSDPLKLGRCQVRIIGLHTHDKTVLPTEDLPWALPMQSITSAAMSGIGSTPLGLVEGTWVLVVFQDEDNQYPIMIGSIGGIEQTMVAPTSDNSALQLNVDGDVTDTNAQSGNTVDGSGSVLTSSDGTPVVSSDGTPVTTGTATTNPTPAPDPKPTSPTITTGTVPPASAKAGIDALNAAMDAVGFTGKYGRATILGIAGGECAWVPKPEGYSYSAESLPKIFAKTFSNKPDLIAQYARWKGTRETFFNFVYAPANNGGSLGNTQPTDGGKYYGRGFIQLTGRANYTKYGKLAGIDLVSQPDLLNDDYAQSARVAVAYFKDRVKTSDSDPSYFQAGLKAIGGAQSGWPKKESFYQYFLGDPTPPPQQTDKSSSPGEEAQSVPVAENGLPADRQQNLVMGFVDPNMKYPLRAYIGEPDTNRLARGKIEGTIVEFKDQKLLDNVMTGGGVTWKQPAIPYNGKYPYNKVMETESGHIMEFDDTPENERVHIYHRKGTYTEIDANGTQVNRIVGDGYVITEHNGYVYIGGDCNVTINGTARVLVNADAVIDVTGDTTLTVGGNISAAAAGSISLNAGTDLKIKANNIFIESVADVNVTAGGANKLTSSSNFEVKAGANANIEGSIVNLANGAASAAASGLGSPPKAGTKNTQSFKQLQPPPRNIEADLGYETPDENKTPGATAYHEERPVSETPPTTTESAPAPVNAATSTDSDCGIIHGMTSFPDSFVLYTDKTGYNWTVGKVLNNNKLTPGTYSTGPGRGTKAMTSQDIVCNLKALCVNILGPINEAIGTVGKAWTMTSCYRSYVPSGGSATSQHLSGCAVDISPAGNYGYKANYDWAVKLAAILPFDQLLLEYRDADKGHPKRYQWIHISYNNYGAGKKELMTFLNDKTYKKNELVLLGEV